ncbi:hypothetical protein EXIGLDRAFT_743981 [Exidia glandulosa HHB12029]|uniref:Uncharacterized protein n=1 Tax=Exidia glandulosa HHB12029 TaxID=1314781 RepID=A0A166BS53_EXIGL|nr:hypothetical protein EXIGLDRAFT_743981 [Exidia glandulosa HHB12029]
MRAQRELGSVVGGDAWWAGRELGNAVDEGVKERNATLRYSPPHQILPPWLSYSTFITTTGATADVTHTVVILPLSYYGPPIPLGTDGVWVYGGLTSPPPTSTASASASGSTSSASRSTTAPISNTIPTSTSAPSSSSVLPSSTTPFSTTPSSTSSSSSAAVTPTSPVAQQSSDHTVLPAWAILLIAITGGLGVGLLLLYAMCWRRRERSSAHPDDTDDEITHSGACFRLLQALPIPRSLRSSMHRHSRVPQSDLEADAHPNHSDWQLVDPAPPMPTTMRNVPSGSGAGVAYGPIIPYRDDDEASDHPPTPASHQTRSSVSQGVLPRVGTNSGSSNASLFFNPRRDNEFAYVAPAPGEVLDRDPRVFPDRYSHMHDATTSMPIVPLAPPPFHSRSRSNTTRTEITQGMDSQRTKVNVGPAPLMAYPDSPVSEVDESAGLLPGLDAAALGLMSGSGRSSRAASPTHTPDRRSPTIVQRLSGLFKRLSGSGPSPSAPAMGTTTPFMSQASPSHQAPQMKEQHPGMLGLGFLSAPPVIASASTRRTHGTADRPMSTISGNTVYHDAHSRPESPYVDAPPLYGTPTDELPLPDLDEPAPRSLRYPPGLTPTEAQFLQNRLSGTRRVSAGLEELEEEDIVGDLRPVGPGAGRVGVEEGMYDVPAPGAEPGWASLAKGKQRAEEEEEADDGEPSARVRKRATLGEGLTNVLAAHAPRCGIGSALSYFVALPRSERLPFYRLAQRNEQQLLALPSYRRLVNLLRISAPSATVFRLRPRSSRSRPGRHACASLLCSTTARGRTVAERDVRSAEWVVTLEDAEWAGDAEIWSPIQQRANDREDITRRVRPARVWHHWEGRALSREATHLSQEIDHLFRAEEHLAKRNELALVDTKQLEPDVVIREIKHAGLEERHAAVRPQYTGDVTTNHKATKDRAAGEAVEEGGEDFLDDNLLAKPPVAKE